MSSGVNIDITANLSRFSSNLDKATQDLNRFQTNSQRISSSIKGSLAGLAAAFGAQQIGAALVSRVEQVQNLELRLKGLSKTAQDYAETESYLAKVSADHHKNILGLADSYSKLLSVEESGVITRKQTQAIFEGLSNAQSKTGASADQLGQSMIGLTQALSMGTLQWEEMKQVTEPIPGLMTKIANAAGFAGESAVGDFKKVVSNGQVTSKMFGEILPIALGKYEGAAAKAAENITAKYADIENSWTSLAKALESPISSTIGAVLDAATWQIGEFVKQAKYAKSVWKDIFGESVTGGAPDNGMITGREPPKPIDDKPAQIRAEIEGNIKAKSAKEHTSALSDEQKAVNSLAKEYDNLVESLSKEVALRSDNSEAAKMEYEIINGSLSALNEGQKLKLLNLAAEKDAIELTAAAYDKVLALAEKQVAEHDRLSQRFDAPRLDLNAGISDAMDARAAGIIPDDAALKKVLDKMGKDYNDLTNDAKESTEQMSEFAVQAARNMESAFADFLFDPFKDGLDGMAANFLNVIRRMAADAAAASIMESLIGKSGSSGSGLLGTVLGAVVGAVGGAFGGGGVSTSAGNSEAFSSTMNSSSFWGAQKFASGGDHIGGLRIVGERGPELEATGPSRIFNADQTKAMLSGGGGGTVNNVSITVQAAKDESPASTGQKIAESFMRAIAKEEIMTASRPGNRLSPVTSF